LQEVVSLQFDVGFVFQMFPFLLKGAGVTLGLSLAGILLGNVLGLLVALARLSKWRPIMRLTGVYISFIRGTPFLVQVLVVFLLIPAWLGIDIPAVLAGIAAMGLNSAAFMGEILRGGIQSLPHGQVEAARALGLSNLQTMRRIVLPQVFILVLPAITNEFTMLVKGSSILSAITVIELTRTGQQLVGTHYKPVEVYIAVALLYLVINFSLSRVTATLESRAVLAR
jgi:polar amino acid transport system permease protein